VRRVERPPLDSEVGQRGNDRLLERPDVAAQVTPARSQVEDRVADELARPVVGRAPAAADLDDVDAAARDPSVITGSCSSSITVSGIACWFRAAASSCMIASASP